jgi:hypothetical protein
MLFIREQRERYVMSKFVRGSFGRRRGFSLKLLERFGRLFLAILQQPASQLLQNDTVAPPPLRWQRTDFAFLRGS